MSKNLKLLLLISSILISCNQKTSIDKAVEKRHSTCDLRATCDINLKTALPFKWDKCYVFDQSYYPEIKNYKEISTFIGIKTKAKREFNQRLIIFTYQKEIVEIIKEEEQQEGVIISIDPLPLHVEFDLSRNKTPYIDQNNANFSIEYFPEKEWYLLTHFEIED